jgi:putative peptide zinc metalloprotease protein
VREGDLICVVEEPTELEAEVALSEQDATRIGPSLPVRLKARAQPYESYAARVDRIAPAAARGEVQSTVTVYCRLENSNGNLRSGMTGYTRVETGPSPVGTILLHRALRFLRTEFWW